MATRNLLFQVRVTRAERATWRKAARVLRKPVADLVRDAMNAHASAIVETDAVRRATSSESTDTPTASQSTLPQVTLHS